MNRHVFLGELHRTLQPKSYLEIGVQDGHSLKLASCPAIGIDPHAARELESQIPNAAIYRMTSDKFFEALIVGGLIPGLSPVFRINLAFIDGDHLIEQVCRDFENVERYCCHPGTLVVFDDVLPYSQGMGARTPCQGDWSGDAWKIWYILNDQHSGLDMRLVNVTPAGLLLVRGMVPENIALAYEEWQLVDAVPEEVLARSWAVSPDEAIEWVKSW